jgi:hypothetical protein
MTLTIVGIPPNSGGPGGAETDPVAVPALNNHIGDATAHGVNNKLDKTANLSDVTTPATALANLGAVGTSDSRLTDQRAPVDGSVTLAKLASGLLIPKSKLDALGLVNADIATGAAIDPAKVAGTAIVNSDSRLSDARTPSDGSVTDAKIAVAGISASKINGLPSGSAAATASALGTLKILGTPGDPSNPVVRVRESADATYLQIANALSELSGSQASARSSLGLGSAALSAASAFAAASHQHGRADLTDILLKALTADVTVTNTTAFSDLTGLSIPIGANATETWLFALFIQHNGPATIGAKVQWNVGTATISGRWGAIVGTGTGANGWTMSGVATQANGLDPIANALSFGTNGAGRGTAFFGLINATGTGGTIQLQGSQAVANATGTIFNKPTTLLAWRTNS